MKSGLTELAFIIDRSGSMSGLEDDTIGGYNSMLKEQQAVEGEAVVTTVLFDDEYELLHDRANIQSIAPLTQEDYTVGGKTALLDAIGMTIHKIRKAQRATQEEFRAEKVLFIIITDGHENASRHYTADMIRERIEHQRQKYGWEFIFFGANMDAIAEAGKIGIDADRALNYQADAFGTQSAYTAMSALSTAFRTGGQILRQALLPSKNTQSQAARAAFFHLKEVMGGLKKSTDELVEQFADLIEIAQANGGKLPDVNEILRQVLSERDKEDKK